MAASLPTTCAQTIVMASHWVGLTLPGMMEEPGSEEHGSAPMEKKPILVVSFLAAAIALVPASFAQDKPAEHTHHGAFMRGGMHHAPAKGVTLDSKVDSNSVTLRVGPMNLPANTDHMKMPQPPDLIWAVPFEGWLLAYHPRLVDSNGNSVPGTVLHHTAFWNENRADFLCPNKEEHIFGAGSEMTDWVVPTFLASCAWVRPVRARTSPTSRRRWARTCCARSATGSPSTWPTTRSPRCRS
jgi:hypothetical protein